MAVIVLGSFNPRIFEPLWLSNQDLVAEPEAIAAERELIDKDFARIVFPWATLIVLGDRLQVESAGETVSQAQVRDLLVGVLRLLPHTPVSMVSIQHGGHVQLDSEEQWHSVGHKLAPKGVWNGILEQPGLFDFAMMGKRTDDLQGSVKVRLQPSQVVHPGLFVNVNDEFVVGEHEELEPARRAADLLEQIWSEAEKRVGTIRSSLLELLTH